MTSVHLVFCRVGYAGDDRSDEVVFVCRALSVAVAKARELAAPPNQDQMGDPEYRVERWEMEADRPADTPFRIKAGERDGWGWAATEPFGGAT